MRPGHVELREEIPRDLVDVIDAVSAARGTSRRQMMIDVLHAWASERVHEATVIMRVTRGNPPLAESSRNTTE